MKEIEEQLQIQKEQPDQTKKISKDKLRKAVEERYWGPISSQVLTKSDLRTLGAERYVHTPGIWQDTIRQVIESRTK